METETSEVLVYSPVSPTTKFPPNNIYSSISVCNIKKGDLVSEGKKKD